MWKIAATVILGVFIGSNAFWIQAAIRDDLRFFHDAATRGEMKTLEDKLAKAQADLQARFESRSQRIEDNARAISTLSAEVLTTLRAMQAQITRIESDVKELRPLRTNTRTGGANP